MSGYFDVLRTCDWRIAEIRGAPPEMLTAVQVWNPDDWELFALKLLQSRHGPLQVQKIPAVHKGDFGIDYYCTNELVVYQCYAVVEPVDITRRAERQKKKITSDLAKLIANHAEISQLFLGAPIKYWVLVVPLHDSKEVNLHCAKKTGEIRSAGCPALDKEFEVSIQDISTFSNGAVAEEISALSKVTLSVPSPSQSELDSWVAESSDLLANAAQKLLKRVSQDQLDGAVAEATKSFLQGNAVLDALRSRSPDLHENITSAIKSRTRRLNFTGPEPGGSAGEVLRAELDALIVALKDAAPSLSTQNAEEIAYGSIYEWIMRCPLDFPNVE